MAVETTRSLRTARILLGFTLVLQIFGTWEISRTAMVLQISARSWKWMSLFGLLGFLLVVTLVLFLSTWRASGLRWASWLAALPERVHVLRPLAVPGLVLMGLALPLFVLIRLPPPLHRLTGEWALRVFVFWMAAIAGAFFLRLWKPENGFVRSLAIVVVGYAAVFRAAAFLPEISRFPFSLGWSEASRYYYASLFLGDRIYDHPVRPTVLHPTRYMLQSIPFWLGQLPLWFHRTWQVFLWLGTNAAAAWILAVRLRRRGRLPAAPVVFALWTFLFLFQAPIWYHLVVMIIVVLWGTDVQNFWRTLAVVGAASIWAGMSRVNWIPFPAALAALIYLLEVPAAGRTLVRYAAPPLAWGIAGGLLGLLSQWGYAVLSGNALEQFTSSFTSDLLWYRLFPSATYPMGILPGILLVLAPAVWAVLQVHRGRWERIEPIRWVGILAILFVFLVGGLVVSVKIGGGSNLHNLDGFVALLLVASTYLVFVDAPQDRRLSQIVVAAAIAVPVGFALSVGGPLPAYDPKAAAADMAALTDLVEAEAADGGEILFIAERHLLSLEQVEGVHLIEDYEKVFLMEMAMAGNPDYLGRLEQELASHRFALIVTENVIYDIQSRARAFSEENNVWDEYVNFPLLCYYQTAFSLQTTSVQVLEPRPTPSCPDTP